MTYTYTAEAIEAANTALLARIDADAPAAGAVDVFDVADTLLVSIALTQPAGTVDEGTGALTLTVAGPGTAVAGGEADHAVLRRGAGAALLVLPVAEGTVAVAGAVTLNTRAILAGGLVELVSAVIG